MVKIIERRIVTQDEQEAKINEWQFEDGFTMNHDWIIVEYIQSDKLDDSTKRAAVAEREVVI